MTVTRTEFMKVCQKLWENRQHHPNLLFAIVTVIELTEGMDGKRDKKIRHCAYCGGDFTNEDPRIVHCSRRCGLLRRHKRRREQLREAA